MHGGVIAVPAAGLATTEVRGSDRLSWLNGLVTVDLREVGPGHAAYGLAVSKVGRVLADLFVVSAGDVLLFAAPSAATEALRASFEKYLVMEDAELVPRPELRVIVLHGADAAAIAAKVAVVFSGHAGAVDAASAEEHGAVLVIDAARENEAHELLASAGAKVLTEDAFEALRIAAGVPRYGVDFDEKTYPQEASLEKRAVSFSKGCYLGQEVVCRLEMRGHVHRRLVTVALDGDAAPAPGAEVRAGDAVVGAITSAAPGVAFAMLKYAQSEPGTHLEVGGLHGTVRPPRDR